MKRLLLTLLIAIPVCAAQAAEPASAQDSSTTAQEQAVSTDRIDASRNQGMADADVDRNCMRYTGSLIARNRAQRADRAERAARKDAAGSTDAVERVADLDRDGCVIASGRVYNRDDLERTGSNDIGEALRKLDPAIR